MGFAFFWSVAIRCQLCYHRCAMERCADWQYDDGSQICRCYPSFITPKQQNIQAHKIKTQSNTNQNI